MDDIVGMEKSRELLPARQDTFGHVLEDLYVDGAQSQMPYVSNMRSCEEMGKEVQRMVTGDTIKKKRARMKL